MLLLRCALTGIYLSPAYFLKSFKSKLKNGQACRNLAKKRNVEQRGF